MAARALPLPRPCRGDLGGEFRACVLPKPATPCHLCRPTRFMAARPVSRMLRRALRPSVRSCSSGAPVAQHRPGEVSLHLGTGRLASCPRPREAPGLAAAPLGGSPGSQLGTGSGVERCALDCPVSPGTPARGGRLLAVLLEHLPAQAAKQPLPGPSDDHRRASRRPLGPMRCHPCASQPASNLNTFLLIPQGTLSVCDQVFL